MKIKNRHYHTIWLKKDDARIIQIIDQRHLPHDFIIEDLASVAQVIAAIKDMHVRGAPLIGITAAFGMYLAAFESSDSTFRKDMYQFADRLKSARPTAVNLNWAVDQQLDIITEDRKSSISLLLKNAEVLKQDSLDRCRLIGKYGLTLIRDLYKAKNLRSISLLIVMRDGWHASTMARL